MHGGEREGLGAGYNVSEPLNTGAIQLEQVCRRHQVGYAQQW